MKVLEGKQFSKQKNESKRNDYKIKTKREKTEQNTQKLHVSQKTIRIAQENKLKIGDTADGQNENYFL